MTTRRTTLVTGGGGNLARRLADRFGERGDRVVLLDLAPDPPVDPNCEAEYVVCDVADRERLEEVFRRERPRIVLHCASLLSGSSEDDRERAWRVNVDGSFAVFEAAIATGTERIFFPSSVAAYGPPLPESVSLDQPQWPTGLYGVTKMAVERLGVYYRERHGLDFRCLRLPVVVSRDAPPGAASAYASRAFVESVERGGYVFRVAREVRPSLVYVKDAIRAITKLVEAPVERLSRGVYNVQALSPTAGELADAIAARRPGVELLFEPDERVNALVSGWPIVLDDWAAREDWGWQPHYDLAAMADDFLAALEAAS